jgi:hypothetical protein
MQVKVAMETVHDRQKYFDMLQGPEGLPIMDATDQVTASRGSIPVKPVS